jgi:hypothetical protein
MFAELRVPSNNPKSDEFYYVLASIWDNAGSYDQIGFADDFGIWGLTYSWTSGPCTTPTYNYSPDAMDLVLGTTYDFYVIIQGGDTWFEAYVGSTLVWYLNPAAPTGATSLSVAYSYCGYYDYTDYIEVWQTDVSGGYPLYMFTFSQNQWYNGSNWIAATWNVFNAGTPPTAVSVVINGQTVTIGPIVPLSQVSSVVSAAADSVWVVMPDYMAGVDSVVHNSASKCGGVGVALATDVYAATYFFGSFTNPQNEVLDTNSAYVSQSSCGQPTTSTAQPIVTVAGPLVNEVVQYYESTSAPLYYTLSTGCIARRDTRVNVDCSTPTVTNDVFVMEAFTDPAGRTVFMIYGRAWPGTLAGFEYVVNFVLKNPTAYTSSWYVYRWQDATSGASANSIPDPGDTYTQIASGP